MSIITNWTDENTQKFQKEIMTFKHNLNETGLFTDEALIKLLDKHPSHMLDVCTMGDPNHALYPNRLRTGDFRECGGEVLLNAAKSGRVWINLRRAMNQHPEYKKVMDCMYGDLAIQTGSKTFNPNGGILISSPIAKVPYHFDKTETILWHVRGRKRIYLYPLTPEFISDDGYERALMDLLEDDLPYDTTFDDHASIFDLESDQAITWPMNMPHRVDNQTFCVSVTTEYSTVASGRRNAAMLANATLRHKFGLNPSYWNASPSENYVKSIFGRIIGKTGLAAKTERADLVTFKIDSAAEDFIVDTEPFERNF
jgi:hypothetical protein